MAFGLRACCIFIGEKTFLTSQNNLAFTWDKCSYLSIFLHLMEPNSNKHKYTSRASSFSSRGSVPCRAGRPALAGCHQSRRNRNGLEPELAEPDLSGISVSGFDGFVGVVVVGIFDGGPGSNVTDVIDVGSCNFCSQ